jgi:hypothetical protein
MESFGFNGELRSATGGQAFPQSVFDHWELMNGCKRLFSGPEVILTYLSSAPLDKGGKLEELVKSIRTRKGLKVSRYLPIEVPWTHLGISSPTSRLLTNIMTSFERTVILLALDHSVYRVGASVSAFVYHYFYYCCTLFTCTIQTLLCGCEHSDGPEPHTITSGCWNAIRCLGRRRSSS